MIGFSRRARLDNVVGAPDVRWPGPQQHMPQVFEPENQASPSSRIGLNFLIDGEHSAGILGNLQLIV